MLSVVLSLLDASEVSEDASLMDAGLDSLGATELSRRLTAELGVRVSPTLLFSYPSVREITAHLQEQLGLGEASGAGAEAEGEDADLGQGGGLGQGQGQREGKLRDAK